MGGNEQTPEVANSAMTDPFGRRISYLRVSITDRCDFRCAYCMSEDMTFLPRADLLTLEELDRLCSTFIAKGVRKLRLTGGEPLVRRNMISLVRSLSRHLGSGALHELTLTTNGSQLERFASELHDCGVRRLNVSLDTLDPEKFRAITRWGDLGKVLAGIEAARAAGLAIKINAVVLKDFNEDEIASLMEWAHGKGMGLTLIEVMPMGEVAAGRIDQYVPLSMARTRLAQHFTLSDLDESSGGPARYARVSETGGKLGFITPMTHNFCESCNRVRITCTGTLHTCLGHEDAADLRKPLRASADDRLLSEAIDRAIGLKPKGHDFIIDRRHRGPSVSRHMSVTGG
jgi:cyclic pyranopterin phosphate synthase